jgi:hypothetical protein
MVADWEGTIETDEHMNAVRTNVQIPLYILFPLPTLQLNDHHTTASIHDYCFDSLRFRRKFDLQPTQPEDCQYP